jgi:hypothetical protein
MHIGNRRMMNSRNSRLRYATSLSSTQYYDGLPGTAFESYTNNIYSTQVETKRPKKTQIRTLKHR